MMSKSTSGAQDPDERKDLSVQLTGASSYPHPVTDVDCIETLLSWVFLTGDYAYKVKKPIRLDFVDFSTLTLRHHYCLEELRCNQAFAPELYLGVVPIVRTAAEQYLVGPESDEDQEEIVEWAVKMVQFEPSTEADRRLAAGKLTTDDMHTFGRTLARQHGRLRPQKALTPPATPILDNFGTLRSLNCTATARGEIAELETSTGDDLRELKPLLARRQEEGFVRECHGDLHLANLVWHGESLRAFDCLEFDRSLRLIDVWNDAAFLYMDCSVRGRDDLAYAFIDGYLEVSGDYPGAVLLPFYAGYRSLVRAKVAALRLEQGSDERMAGKMRRHIDWALDRRLRPAGQLFATCGVSGSGKSFWASQLVSPLKAIRLRSDVFRKTLLGLGPDQKTHSSLGVGAYGRELSERVYAGLSTLAADLMRRGENVIVDCANLRAEQRQVFLDAAESVGTRCRFLLMHAPSRVLEQRLSQRQAEGSDPSEADLAVLRWQLSSQEPLSGKEEVIDIDTTQVTLGELLERF